jgi:MscS family membrane protein
MNDIGHSLGSVLEQTLFGVTYREGLIAFALILATLVARRVVSRGVMRSLLRFAERTKADWDEALIKAVMAPVDLFILVYGLVIAANALPLAREPLNLQRFVDVTGQIGAILILAWAMWRVVGAINLLFRTPLEDPDHWLDAGMVQVTANALRILIAMTTGILVAQNLGYSVSGLIASLGIGGAAVALASKDTVANLFGSMMILIDKPFKVGDWIKGADFEGVVEEIGFRSTRIRTFSKTVEVIPNNVMANVLVENIDRRRDPGLNVRRIVMTVGVTYATDADTMERLLAGIKEILAVDEGVDARMTTLVRFTDFGASSLDIFLYYFSNSADWDYYLSVRERVNLKIMRLIASMGVAIAFPSRSVYIESTPPYLAAGGEPVSGESTGS